MSFHTPRQCSVSCVCDPRCVCELRASVGQDPEAECGIVFSGSIVRICSGVVAELDPADYNIWGRLESFFEGEVERVYYYGPLEDLDADVTTICGRTYRMTTFQLNEIGIVGTECDNELILAFDEYTETRSECCICTPDLTPVCECATDDYPIGSKVPARLQITIPADTSLCILAGNPGLPCAPISGLDFSGTYIIDCDEEVIQEIGTFLGAGKQEELRSEYLFMCTRSGVDYYLVEDLTLFMWRIPGASSLTDVLLIFSTSYVTYNEGDTPGVDAPITPGFGVASRQYYYVSPNTFHLDECGVARWWACSELTLDSEFSPAPIMSSWCTHSTDDADYKPSVVWIGTI